MLGPATGQTGTDPGKVLGEHHLGYRVFCRVDNFFDHWIGSEGPAGPVRDRVRAPRWRANPVRLYWARAARRLGRSIRRRPSLRGGNGGRGAGHLSPLAGRKLRAFSSEEERGGDECGRKGCFRCWTGRVKKK